MCAGEDVDDVGLGGDFFEVRDCGRGVGGVVQEDQRDVVVCDPLCGDAGVVHDNRGVDFSVECWIDRRLAVLGCDDDERVVVDALGLEFFDDGADGRVDRVDGFEEEWGEREAGGVLVAADFLPNVHGLQVAGEEGGDGCETALGVLGDLSVQPVEPRVDVEEVVGDCGGDVGAGDGLDLGEVAGGQAGSTRTADNIIRRVFVSVGCFEAFGHDDFEGGVDAETGVGVLDDAFPVLNPHR